MKFKEYLKTIKAPYNLVQYLGDMTAEEWWNCCDRGDWLLFLAAKRRTDVKLIIKANVKCARLVQHLMKDQRSLDVLDVADRFVGGRATIKELLKAVDAASNAATSAQSYVYDLDDEYYDSNAYVLSDAAFAAYAASDIYAYAGQVARYAAGAISDDYFAQEKVLKDCADIVRDVIPFEALNLTEIIK